MGRLSIHSIQQQQMVFGQHQKQRHIEWWMCKRNEKKKVKMRMKGANVGHLTFHPTARKLRWPFSFTNWSLIKRSQLTLFRHVLNTRGSSKLARLTHAVIHCHAMATYTNSECYSFQRWRWKMKNENNMQWNRARHKTRQKKSKLQMIHRKINTFIFTLTLRTAHTIIATTVDHQFEKLQSIRETRPATADEFRKNRYCSK